MVNSDILTGLALLRNATAELADRVDSAIEETTYCDYCDGLDDRHIRGLERSMWRCCNALATIRRDQGPMTAVPDSIHDNDRIAVIVQAQDQIVIRVPYMRRLAHHCDSRVVYSDLLDGMYEISRELFAAAQIDMYVVTIYATGTPHGLVIDADNLNIKAIGDPLTQLLGIDDNGIDVYLHMYASITDELLPATYAYVVPRSDNVMSVGAVIDAICAMI